MNINPVKEFRLRHRLSQRKLAEKLGVVQSAVAQYESGRRYPERSVIQSYLNLSKELGDNLSICQILGIEDAA